MGSSQQSSLQGGAGLFGASALINAKDKLLVFGNSEDLHAHGLLIQWLKADAICLFAPRTGYRYKEIIIMPMLAIYSMTFKNAVADALNDIETHLIPGGRIVNLNDLNEEQNEPQGLSGQADASEPNAG